MAQQTISMIQANPPCHPDAMQREDVKGIPVGVRADGRVHKCVVACPECGQDFTVRTRRGRRQVRVDWEPL